MPAAAAVLHQHGWRTIRRDVFLISHESHLLLLPFTNSKQAFRFFYLFFTNVAFLLFLSISLRFWLASNSVHICQIGDNLERPKVWNLVSCDLFLFFFSEENWNFDVIGPRENSQIVFLGNMVNWANIPGNTELFIVILRGITEQMLTNMFRLSLNTYLRKSFFMHIFAYLVT